MDERIFNVWVIARPSPDVPGQWVAHCLDFDVVSMGDSLDHALRMVHEASVMVALDDLNKDREPLERRAPPEFFGELYGLFERGEKMSYEQLREAEEAHRIVAYATQFELRFERQAGNLDVVARSMRPVPVSIAQQLTC
jgi:hypothetical protein